MLFGKIPEFCAPVGQKNEDEKGKGQIYDLNIFTASDMGSGCPVPGRRKESSKGEITIPEILAGEALNIVPTTHDKPWSITMGNRKVSITGAAGTIASKIIPDLRDRYDLYHLDITKRNVED